MVFILVFLYKSNSSSIYIDNTFIKLEIIVNSKAFILLSQELSFLELQLFYFYKIVSSNKQGIISLKANNSEGLLIIEEARIIS